MEERFSKHRDELRWWLNKLDEMNELCTKRVSDEEVDERIGREFKRLCYLYENDTDNEVLSVQGRYHMLWKAIENVIEEMKLRAEIKF